MDDVKYKIAVVGAGIIGLSSAVCIAETMPDVRVTVLADHFTPDTTGDIAAGLWMPYLLSKTPAESQRFWAKQTFDFLNQLFANEQSSEIGISLVAGYVIDDDDEVEGPIWKDIPFGYRPMSEGELRTCRAKKGASFTTFVTECTHFLPYLTKRFLDHGGRLEKRKVKSLEELTDYDVVVNCPGVWAGELTDDQDVHPVRGQVTRVSAPWVKTFILGPDFYIIPNINCVILGGTSQKGDWNRNPDPRDRDLFTRHCLRCMPSLKNARVLKEVVGLRPGRTSVRLERQPLKYGPRTLQVIHNYGHGGSGVTLFWGCAQKVSQLVRDVLNEIAPTEFGTPKSRM